MITWNSKAPEILFTCPTPNLYLYVLTIIWILFCAMYSNWSVLVSVSSLLTRTGFYTGELQAYQLSWFTVSLTISVQVSRFHGNVSYSHRQSISLQRRMWCDVGNGRQILLNTEEGRILMRLNCIHTNFLSEGWWNLASIKAVSDLEIAHLPTVSMVYEQFHWGHTHL